MPFLRSLRCPSMQVSAMPYLTQRSHGLLSSHRLQAPAQLVHYEIKQIRHKIHLKVKFDPTAILTCFRLGRESADGAGLAWGAPNAT